MISTPSVFRIDIKIVIVTNYPHLIKYLNVKIKLYVNIEYQNII